VNLVAPFRAAKFGGHGLVVLGIENWTGSANRNGQQDRQRDSSDSAAVHGTNLATKGLTMHARILEIGFSEQKKIPTDVKKKYQSCKPLPPI
jgi:hypothetical protein